MASWPHGLKASDQRTFEERLLEALDERIRALTVAANGWIYFSADRGRILRPQPQS